MQFNNKIKQYLRRYDINLKNNHQQVYMDHLNDQNKLAEKIRLLEGDLKEANTKIEYYKYNEAKRRETILDIRYSTHTCNFIPLRMKRQQDYEDKLRKTSYGRLILWFKGKLH